jgi:hypothetical protein
MRRSAVWLDWHPRIDICSTSTMPRPHSLYTCRVSETNRLPAPALLACHRGPCSTSPRSWVDTSKQRIRFARATTGQPRSADAATNSPTHPVRSLEPVQSQSPRPTRTPAHMTHLKQHSCVLQGCCPRMTLTFPLYHFLMHRPGLRKSGMEPAGSRRRSPNHPPGYMPSTHHQRATLSTDRAKLPLSGRPTSTSCPQ